MGKYVSIKVVDRYRKAGRPEASFSLKRLLVGDPLATSEVPHQRISKTVALAVFSSDALSSCAYATEEILIALTAAGAAGLVYGLPIALCITTLLAIVLSAQRPRSVAGCEHRERPVRWSVVLGSRLRFTQ